MSFVEIPCVDLPGSAAKSEAIPKLTAGPYIVKMGTDSVTIMWQTDIPAVARIVVHNTRSTGEYMMSKPARLDSLKIAGLSPDTHYTYRIWVCNSRRLSKGVATDSFQTFPAKPRPVTFAVYGDTRSNPDRHARVVNAMAGEKSLDFVLHSGDLVGDGRKLDLWVPGYFTPARGLIGRVPFYSVQGNHDGETFYRQLFGDLPRYYSFDVLGIHVIGLDSIDSFDVGSKQYDWLVSDLTKHKDARWKFVFVHAPVYTSGPHGAADANGVIKEVGVRTAHKVLPALAAKFGIQAVFSGHDHFYERSVHDGVDYIVSGGGGAENYSDVNVKLNPYRKTFYSGLHYCVVTVDGNKASLVVKTPDGKVLDKVDL